jgi:hypothetical protein
LGNQLFVGGMPLSLILVLVLQRLSRKSRASYVDHQDKFNRNALPKTMLTIGLEHVT